MKVKSIILILPVIMVFFVMGVFAAQHENETSSLSEPSTLPDYGAEKKTYTQEFYIATGVAALGVIALILFIIFFFKKPKASWEKKTASQEQGVPFHRRFMRTRMPLGR